MGGYCESQGPAIGSQASFKILSGTAGIPHFFSSSAVLLQWRSKFWKLAWEPIAAYFWSKCRTQLEISVSKMGFMLPDLKNHSKSVKRFRLKNGKSWCLANEHFFFLRPCCNSTVFDIHYCIDTVSIQYRYCTGGGPSAAAAPRRRPLGGGGPQDTGTLGPIGTHRYIDIKICRYED